jgi:hypothetical protein
MVGFRVALFLADGIKIEREQAKTEALRGETASN